MFALAGVRSVFAVLYPAMVLDMGWTTGEVTGAFSTGVFVYALLAIPVGFSVDRFGCRFMLLFGTVAIVVGLVISALATEIWHLYLAYVLVCGLGSGGIGFIVVTKLIALKSGRRFATSWGMAFAGQGLGSLIASPAVQLLLEATDWRLATAAFGMSLGLMMLPLCAVLAPGPIPHPPSHHAGAAPGSVRALLLTPLGAMFLVCSLGLGFQMLVPTHMVAYLLELDFGATIAATAAGVWGMMLSVGSLSGGFLLDRYGSKLTLLFALVLFIAGTLALVISSPAAWWLLVAYVLGGGLGRGLLNLVLSSVQTQSLSGPRLGLMIGILDFAFGCGAFLGPWGSALVHDRIGTLAPGFLATIPSALLVAGGIVVAGRLAGPQRRAR